MPNIKSTTKSVTKTESKSKDQKPKSKLNLSIQSYSIDGKAQGLIKLPEEIFGKKINTQLLSQAVRVYMTNEKIITASTKTRGEVVGSRIKIYRQKGTGRARHGGITAPIFVGGGIVFGPKPRKVTLNLPKKMKKIGLISALSDKAKSGLVSVLSKTEKLTGKTKELAQYLENVIYKDKKINSVLIITANSDKKLHLATRNIPSVKVLPVNLLNIYEIVKHQFLVLTEEAIEKLSKKEPEDSVEVKAKQKEKKESK